MKLSAGSRLARPRALATLLCGGLLAVSVGCGPGTKAPGAGAPDAPAEEVVTFDLSQDSRILQLLEACDQSGAYDRNLADPLDVLLEKLDRGYGVALKRAREELGAMGERSMEALERRYREDETSAIGLPRLRGTLDAIALNPSDSATLILAEALTHTDGAIRAQAMRALEGRVFDPILLERMPDLYGRISNAVAFNLLNTAADEGINALQRLDAERSADLFLAMLDQPGLTIQWQVALPHLATSDTSERLDQFRERVGSMGAPYAVYLHAALARNGDEASQRFLEESLTTGDITLRVSAMRAATAGGLWELVEAAAATDPDAEGRLAAMTLLAEQAAQVDVEGRDREAQVEVLDRALRAIARAHDDPVREIRDAAVVIGMRLDDPTSIDLALSRLAGGQRRDLELVLPELRARMREKPNLARRAFAQVAPEWEALKDRPLTEKVKFATTLGQIPLAESADLLLELASEAEGHIDSLRAHHWVALQLASTGDAGRARVVERLAVETDSQRRLDLLFAIAADRDEYARKVILKHVEADSDIDPFERLYAASLLANLGPADIAAPAIKRAAARVEGLAREGFWCLLATWY